MEQRDLPPIDVNREPLVGPVSYHPVSAAGRYDFEQEVLLRGRVLQGIPGVQVVTPLRLPGRDTAVLINRGFVPTPDAGAPAARDYFREPGPIRLVGIAISIPDEGDGQPLTTPTGETWHRLDLTALRERIGYPIASYVVLAAADPSTIDHTIDGRAFPIRVEPPSLDDGPHLSYAIQWFLIGGAALAFGIIFVRRRPGQDDAPY